MRHVRITNQVCTNKECAEASPDAYNRLTWVCQKRQDLLYSGDFDERIGNMILELDSAS